MHIGAPPPDSPTLESSSGSHLLTLTPTYSSHHRSPSVNSEHPLPSSAPEDPSSWGHWLSPLHASSLWGSLVVEDIKATVLCPCPRVLSDADLEPALSLRLRQERGDGLGRVQVAWLGNLSLPPLHSRKPHRPLQSGCSLERPTDLGSSARSSPSNVPKHTCCPEGKASA